MAREARMPLSARWTNFTGRIGLVSNDSRGGAGSDDRRGQSQRVGTAERSKAIALLGEHWRAGRLDRAEHELRVTRAKAAVTRDDVDALFADLPQPGPVAEPTVAVVSGGPGGLFAGQRDTIMALIPFASLLLFFLTGTWLWFLAIPVSGILLYGAEGRKKARPKGGHLG